MAVSSGEITSTISTYSPNGCNVVSTSCVKGLAPCERVKICVTMDKVSYNNSIFENNSSGDFDTNFNGFSVRYLDVDPITGTFYPPNTIPGAFFNITENTSEQATLCAEFRVPEEWAGELKYIVPAFNFNVGGNTEVVYFPISLRTVDYTTPVNVDIELLDENGAPIGVLDLVFCENLLNDVKVSFEIQPGNEGDIVNYYLHRPQGSIGEYNGTTNDCFSQQQADEIAIAGGLVGADNINSAILNLDLLQVGVNCLKMVVKDDPETCSDCTPFGGTIALNVIQENSTQSLIQVDYDFSLIPCTATHIEIDGVYYPDLAGSFTYLQPLTTPPTSVEKCFHVVIHSDCCTIYREDICFNFVPTQNAMENGVIEFGCDCTVTCEVCTYVREFVLVSSIVWITDIVVCNEDGDTISLNTQGGFQFPYSDTNISLIEGHLNAWLSQQPNGGTAIVTTSGLNSSFSIESCTEFKNIERTNQDTQAVFVSDFIATCPCTLEVTQFTFDCTTLDLQLGWVGSPLADLYWWVLPVNSTCSEYDITTSLISGSSLGQTSISTINIPDYDPALHGVIVVSFIDPENATCEIQDCIDPCSGAVACSIGIDSFTFDCTTNQAELMWSGNVATANLEWWVFDGTPDCTNYDVANAVLFGTLPNESTTVNWEIPNYANGGGIIVARMSVTNEPTCVSEICIPACPAAACSNDLAVAGAIVNDCLEITTSGSSTETPLTDALEYNINSTTWEPFDPVNPPCDCTIQNELAFDVSCSITAGGELRLDMSISESCKFLAGSIPIADSWNATFGDGSSSGASGNIINFSVQDDEAGWDTKLNTVTISAMVTSTIGVITVSQVVDVPTPLDCATVTPVTPFTAKETDPLPMQVRRTLTFPTCPIIVLTEDV